MSPSLLMKHSTELLKLLISGSAVHNYIIESSEINTVIIGLPKMLDGTIGVQAQKVIDFTNILKSKINVPFIFWDERLTTSEVNKMLINANVRRSKRREVADILSAQLILQGYLDRKRIQDNNE